MPPSTPAPAAEHIPDDEAILSALSEQTGDFFLPKEQVSDVRASEHDTDAAEDPEWGDTDRVAGPIEHDPEAARAVAEHIRALATGVIAPQRVPFVDDMGEPDVFLETLAQSGVDLFRRANDSDLDEPTQPGFRIDLDSPDLEDTDNK